MLPYKHYTIESQLSTEEIINRLNRLTQNSDFDDSSQKKKRYFTGAITDNSFKIIQTSGNIEKGIVKGIITQNQNYSIIKFNTKPSSGLLTMLFFILGSLTAFIISGDSLKSIFFKTAGLLFLVIIFLWDFYNSSSVLKKNLVTLFTQEIKEQ
ncbi:hypothetical protein FUA48_10555 [Flavobacterium alkalisoli]|uniref:Uncharacterized protein n=1 Tax=Flavobacterium alkalisoli TaxID=2602769 RepID=A0A5B9FT44_9FLAO|nr:hypothetical protein [Flavobacterium alkalisoli]QEE50004.1 hypothetical protein FUA48_10555 [Flavobacterium alkalisoli]